MSPDTKYLCTTKSFPLIYVALLMYRMPYLNNVTARLLQKALASALMCAYKDNKNISPKSGRFQTVYLQVTGMLTVRNLKLR